jgi:hypothetical protein
MGWRDTITPIEQGTVETQPAPTTPAPKGSWRDSITPIEVQAPKAKTEGTFDEHLDTISKKYGVSPSTLRNYALDVGSKEAADSMYGPRTVESAVGKKVAELGGIAQSVTFGLPGKAFRYGAGVVKGANYEKALDEVQELVDERKTLPQKAQELVAGMVMTPTGVAGKGVNLLGKIGYGAAAGAGAGALAGLGGSKAGEVLPSVGMGVATGGVLGAAGGAVGQVLEKRGAEKVAESLGVGSTKKARERMAKEGVTLEQKGQELMKKVPSWFSSTEDVYKQVQEGRKTIGKGIGEIIQLSSDLESEVLQSHEARAQGQHLADLLRARANELADTPKDRLLAKQLMKEADRYSKKGEIPLTNLQETKVALDNRINYDAKKNIDNTLDKNIRDVMKAALESRIIRAVERSRELIGRSGPSITKGYDKYLETYQQLSNQEKDMVEMIQRGYKPKEVAFLPSLKQTLAVLGITSAGGPATAIPSYLGTKALEYLETKPGFGKLMYETGTTQVPLRAAREVAEKYTETKEKQKAKK